MTPGGIEGYGEIIGRPIDGTEEAGIEGWRD